MDYLNFASPVQQTLGTLVLHLKALSAIYGTVALKPMLMIISKIRSLRFSFSQYKAVSVLQMFFGLAMCSQSEHESLITTTSFPTDDNHLILIRTLRLYTFIICLIGPVTAASDGDGVDCSSVQRVQQVKCT